MIEIGSSGSNQSTFICDLTFSVNLAIQLQTVSSFLGDLIERRYIQQSSAFAWFLFIVCRTGSLTPTPIISCTFCTLIVMERTSHAAGDNIKFSDVLEDDDFLLFYSLFRSSSCGISVFLCLYFACLRTSTSTDDCDTDGESESEENKDSVSYRNISSLLDFFWNLRV